MPCAFTTHVEIWRSRRMFCLLFVVLTKASTFTDGFVPEGGVTDCRVNQYVLLVELLVGFDRIEIKLVSLPTTRKMFAMKRNVSVKRKFQFANHSLVWYVLQTMNPNNHTRIISTHMCNLYTCIFFVNEFHCPQPPTRTLKALPNADVNMCATYLLYVCILCFPTIP